MPICGAQFAAAIPERAPSFYFLDIPVQDADRFDDFVRAQAPRATLVRVPMLRGRIVAAHGTKAEDLAPKPDAAWVLQSDRGITYTSELPAGSRLTDGEWWDKDYAGPTLVSFEKKVAEGLGLKIGDDITVNVLGRNMTARIAKTNYPRDLFAFGLRDLCPSTTGSFRAKAFLIVFIQLDSTWPAIFLIPPTC